jgi:phosphoglycolate phosphatase
MAAGISPPDALLLDLDGTIADTLADIAVALDAARAAESLPPVGDRAQVRSWIGHGARKLVARSLGTEDVEAPGVAQLLTTFRRLYPEISGRHSQLYPGVRELLERLRARGLPLGLTTNKPREATHVFLEQLGAASLFDAVFTPDDVDNRVKPDPAMLIAAAGALGVPVGHCLLVGDGDADVNGARAAGMPVVAVLDGFGNRDALLALGADAYVERLTDAESLLKYRAR